MAKASVTQGSLVSVDLWHLANARVNFTCYLWCTGTGKVPKTPRDNDTVHPDLVPKLVRMFFT